MSDVLYKTSECGGSRLNTICDPTGAHVAPAAAKATTKDESEHKLAASLESIAQPAALALLAHAAEHVSHAGLVSEPLFQTPAHQRGVPNVNSGGYRTNGQADNRAIVAPKPNMQSPTPATGVLTQGLQDLGTAVKAPSTAEAVAGVASFVGSMTPVTQVQPLSVTYWIQFATSWTQKPAKGSCFTFVPFTLLLHSSTSYGLP